MRKARKITLTKFLLILLFISFPMISSAQDIHFSQVIFSPLTLNPALAGANHEFQGATHYRKQWSGVVPYNTIAASFDSRLRKDKRTRKSFFAAGLNIVNDKAGAAQLSITNASFNIAFHLPLNENSSLGGGGYGGIGQRKIDPATGSWGNQYDGSQFDPSLPHYENFITERKLYPDVGAGLVYNYRKNTKNVLGNDQVLLNAGIAAFHLNRPAYSFLNDGREKLFVRWTGFVNGSFGIRYTNLSLVPGLYYTRQGKANEILGGSYFRYIISESSRYTQHNPGQAFSVGVFYRNMDAFVLKTLLEWSTYSVGISYDINVSRLSRDFRRRGAVEICLRYLNPF